MTIFVVQKHDIMSLERVLQRRINNLKLSLKQMEDEKTIEGNLQLYGKIADSLDDMLEMEKEAKIEDTDQEVEVKLTLSVPINMDTVILRHKIETLVELIEEITVMEIEVKEEAEIYENE